MQQVNTAAATQEANIIKMTHRLLTKTVQITVLTWKQHAHTSFPTLTVNLKMQRKPMSINSLVRHLHRWI